MGGLMDRALVEFMVDKCILPTWGPGKQIKIALIGERKDTKSKGSLAYLIHKRFRVDLKKITIFTESKKFRACDGRRFELLIGTRPCNADKLILKAAEKYDKQFILIPCACGRYGKRVMDLIRNYPVIEELSCRSEMFINSKTGKKTYYKHGWVIFYNKKG